MADHSDDTGSRPARPAIPPFFGPSGRTGGTPGGGIGGRPVGGPPFLPPGLGRPATPAPQAAGSPAQPAAVEAAESLPSITDFLASDPTKQATATAGAEHGVSSIHFPHRPAADEPAADESLAAEGGESATPYGTPTTDDAAAPAETSGVWGSQGWPGFDPSDDDDDAMLDGAIDARPPAADGVAPFAQDTRASEVTDGLVERSTLAPSFGASAPPPLPPSSGDRYAEASPVYAADAADEWSPSEGAPSRLDGHERALEAGVSSAAVASRLEQIAVRIRRGEIAVPSGTGAEPLGDVAALAAALAGVAGIAR